MFDKLYDRFKEEGAYVYRPKDSFDETNAKHVKKFLEQVADDTAILERNYEKLVKKANKQRINASKAENSIKEIIKKAYGERESINAEIGDPAHKNYVIQVKNGYAFNILHDSLDRMHEEKYFSYNALYNIPMGVGTGYGCSIGAVLAGSLIPLVGFPIAAGAVGVMYHKSKKNDARKKMFRKLRVVNG